MIWRVTQRLKTAVLPQAAFDSEGLLPLHHALRSCAPPHLVGLLVAAHEGGAACEFQALHSGPSSRNIASWPAQRALLMPETVHGSLCRCGKSA